MNYIVLEFIFIFQLCCCKQNIARRHNHTGEICHSLQVTLAAYPARKMKLEFFENPSSTLLGYSPLEEK